MTRAGEGVTYNNIGQLTQSSNSNVTNSYLTFDRNGRVLTSSVQVGGATYPFTYTYDLAGDLSSETYPSGRKLSMSYDMIQRPQTASGTAGSTTTPYVQSAQEISRKSEEIRASTLNHYSACIPVSHEEGRNVR